MYFNPCSKLEEAPIGFVICRIDFKKLIQKGLKNNLFVFGNDKI